MSSHDESVSSRPEKTGGGAQPAQKQDEPAKKTKKKTPKPIPMPLIAQGFIEAFAVSFISAALLLIPMVLLWSLGAFADMALDALAMMTGQLWLSGHGVPIDLDLSGPIADEAFQGTWRYLPWGWTLVCVLLGRRAGRRLGRASTAPDLWKSLVGALTGFLVFAAGTTQLVSTETGTVHTLAGTLIPPAIFGIGLVWGMIRYHGGIAEVLPESWVDRTAETVERMTTRTRWGFNYLGAIFTTGFIGVLGVFGLSALLVSVNVIVGWAGMTDVYQRLDTGFWGGLILTLGQIAVLPNFVVYTMSFVSGVGFHLGTDSLIAPAGSVVGAQPALPILATLPTEQTLSTMWWVFLLPIAAGMVAGWWCFRQGENHAADWIHQHISQRILATTLSTLFTGLVIGLASFAIALLPLWLSSGSWAFGKFSLIGPQIWLTATALGAEIAIGAMLGYLLAPFGERNRE